VGALNLCHSTDQIKPLSQLTKPLGLAGVDGAACAAQGFSPASASGARGNGVARGVVGILPSGGRDGVAVGCESGGAAQMQDIYGHSKGPMPSSSTLKLAPPPRLYVVRMCLSCVCVLFDFVRFVCVHTLAQRDDKGQIIPEQ
jgi:hypothetical protein